MSPPSPSPNRLLFEAAQTVLSASSADEAVRRVLAAARQVIHFDVGGVYWARPDEGVLSPAVTVGADRLAPQLAAWEIPLERSIAGRVARSGQGELVNDAQADPRSAYPDAVRPAREHVICLPLLVEGHPEAVLLVARVDGEPFAADEFELLQLFAGYVSIALQNARHQERLRTAAAVQEIIANSGTHGLLLVDRDGRLLQFNERAAQMAHRLFGRRLQLGEPLQAYVRPEDQASFAGQLQRALAGERGSVERNLQVGPGPDAWFEFHYEPVTDDAGQVSAVCILAVPVGDRVLERRRREALLRVGRRLAAAGQATDVLQAVMEEAVALLNGDDAGIATWDAERGRLVQAASYLPSANQGVELDLERSASGRAATSRAAVLVNDYQRAVGPTTPAGSAGAAAVVAVPLLHEGRLLGTLSVSSFKPHAAFDHHAADALVALGETAAAALVGVEKSRIEGVQLAIRTAQHEVNNQLALAIGYSEMLSLSERVPSDLRGMAEEALRGAQGASDALERLRQVTRLVLVDNGAPGGATINLPQPQPR